jgi:RNA polymerase sigma-70 factor (ECF subfamily)
MKSSDPARLGRWYDAYGQALVLYARQWLPAAAEDVVQEVFLRLLHKWREPAQVKAWLFRSVRNAALSRLRSERRRQTHEQQRALRQGERFFEARPDDRIDAAVAQAALMSLPDEQREVIVLRIWAGITLAEASEVTGDPVSTLFSRYAAGLAALRKALEAPCDKKTS